MKANSSGAVVPLARADRLRSDPEHKKIKKEQEKHQKLYYNSYTAL